jgi:hypothetical protein
VVVRERIAYVGHIAPPHGTSIIDVTDSPAPDSGPLSVMGECSAKFPGVSAQYWTLLKLGAALLFLAVARGLMGRRGLLLFR